MIVTFIIKKVEEVHIKVDLVGGSCETKCSLKLEDVNKLWIRANHLRQRGNVARNNARNCNFWFSNISIFDRVFMDL